MHRTEGTNNSGNTFTNGPPGTRVEENWLNAIQNEIVNVVEGAGLTLKTASSETGNQLLAALNLLYLGADDILGKNAIINGDFRVAQSGTVFTSATVVPNSDDTYLLDQWILLSDGNDIVDVTQTTEVPTGALNSIGLDVETVNKKFGIFQPIEQKNCIHMIDGTVSLSFQAKVTSSLKLNNIKAAIVSWDGVADTITSDIISSWNAEATTPTLAANWTFENTPADLSVTDEWASYTIENVAIDTSSTNNIGVFIWSDGFCDTAGNFLYITNVQLEKNTVASNYDFRCYEQELSASQRYYVRFDAGNVSSVFGAGLIDGTTTGLIYHKFPVEMRSNPTFSTTGSLLVYDQGGSAVTSTAIYNPSTFGSAVTYTCSGGGLTLGRGCLLRANSDAAAYIDFDARL